MVRRLMRAAALALGLAAASAQQSSEGGKEFATSLTPGKAATDSQSSNMYVGTPGTSTMWIQASPSAAPAAEPASPGGSRRAAGCAPPSAARAWDHLAPPCRSLC